MHYIKVLANPLATQLVESPLTPARVSEISIDKIIEDLESRSYSRIEYSCIEECQCNSDDDEPHDHFNQDHHLIPCFNEMIRKTTQAFAASLSGLCLTCVRMGEEHKKHRGGEGKEQKK